MNNKIKISIDLLKEVINTFKQGSEKSEVQGTLQALEDFISDDNFKNQNNDDMENMSYEILTDTMEICLPHLYKQCDYIPGNQYRECTKRQAEKMLLKDYANSAVENDILSMNINEWVDSNHIVIKEKRKKVRHKNFK